jgi:PPOX class probable F420-dependent enzyme
MELPGDAIDRILERWPVAALATSGERGPHAVPIVFVRAGGALWSPIDGKPKRGGELARVRRIRRDPRVSLLFANYDEDWMRLWWLRLDGEAEIRNASEQDRGTDESTAIAELRQKYPQYASVPVLGPDALLLRITVTSRSSWCASQAGAAGLLVYLSRGANRDL